MTDGSIDQHWLSQWLSALKQQAITCAKIGPDWHNKVPTRSLG